MNERLKFLGRLEEKRLEAEQMKLRMEGLRDSVRDILDPFEPVEHVKADAAAALTVELAAVQIRLREALAEMTAIRKALSR
ncbi:MAG: hypothetical protein HPY84_04115 [Syntrophobacteraceae bacterium]|nr:hypothetical protein [Syntrophobacteraceae bacterium]